MSNKRTTLIMVAAGATFLFLGSNNVLAKTIFVDVNCMGAGKGTEKDPFCTIQEAVDDADPSAAPPGDTIHVAAGTYIENVLIAKNLTLMGAGPGEGSTIVKGMPGLPVI